MVTIENIEQCLGSRLSRFNIDAGTITQVAREIGSICGAESFKRYRVEYINETAKVDYADIEAESETMVYKRFTDKPEYKRCSYLKCTLIE